MEPDAPLILNRYRPLETRGVGGSGTVEICWDTRIQRRVAIKRMPLSSPAANGNDGAIAGLAEARTGALLSHPHIVSVIDFETTGEEALLIMEAIEGPTLAELIDVTPAGAFDLDIAAYITESVASALDFAHENQVLHLDVKPENILITQGGTAKVSDFGVSELADAQGFGQACGGTIGYMPPEQMQGLDLDQRCDEFALAVVVYEMLTGRSPFMAPTMEASERLIERSTLEPPSALREDVAPELDEALLAALSPDRTARYETVYDFTGALDGLLGDAREGARKLKALAQPDDEQGDAQERHARKPALPENLWARVPHGLSAALGRLANAALCWWVALLGIQAFGGFPLPTAAALALIAGAAGALKPAFGGLLALCTLGAGFMAAPGYPTPTGAAFIACALLWVVFCRDQRAADVNCALVAAPFGLAFLKLLPPLLAGVFLPPKRAFFAALVGALLTFAVQGVSLLDAAPEAAAFPELARPSTLVCLAGYAFSAVMVSGCCARQTRLLSIVGVSAGAAALFATRVIATWALTGAWSAPDGAWAVMTLVAWIIAVVVCALGVPRREEGKD